MPQARIASASAHEIALHSPIAPPSRAIRPSRAPQSPGTRPAQPRLGRPRPTLCAPCRACAGLIVFSAPHSLVACCLEQGPIFLRCYSVEAGVFITPASSRARVRSGGNSASAFANFGALLLRPVQLHSAVCEPSCSLRCAAGHEIESLGLQPWQLPV